MTSIQWFHLCMPTTQVIEQFGVVHFDGILLGASPNALDKVWNEGVGQYSLWRQIAQHIHDNDHLQTKPELTETIELFLHITPDLYSPILDQQTIEGHGALIWDPTNSRTHKGINVPLESSWQQFLSQKLLAHMPNENFEEPSSSIFCFFVKKTPTGFLWAKANTPWNHLDMAPLTVEDVMNFNQRFMDLVRPAHVMVQHAVEFDWVPVHSSASAPKYSHALLHQLKTLPQSMPQEHFKQDTDPFFIVRQWFEKHFQKHPL